MTTYVFRQLSSGNLSLKKIINFKQVGSIIGRVDENKGYIYNIDVSLENRRHKHGSELLKVYETLLKHNYNINQIRVSAWENISNPFSITQFYNFNEYNINLDNIPQHYDDKLNVFEINQYSKKL